MRWINFEQNGQTFVGYQIGDRVQPVAAKDMFAVVDGRGRESVGGSLSLDDVQLLAPIRPGKVICGDILEVLNDQV